MTTTQLRDALDDLAESAPDASVYAWGPAVRARNSQRRRHNRVRAGMAVPAVAAAVALALVVPQLGSEPEQAPEQGSVAAPIASDPNWTLPATLPPVTNAPPSLADEPIRSASMLVGWDDGAHLQTLLLGAAGEGYRSLPGEQKLVKGQDDLPDSRCWGRLSPDGTKVACPHAGGTVSVIELATGRTTSIGAPGATTTSRVSWGPDGQGVAYLEFLNDDGTVAGARTLPTRTRLHVVSADGVRQSVEVGFFAMTVSWSPDGQTIAVSGDMRKEFALVDVQNGTLTVRPSLLSPGGRVVFTADGKHLVGLGSDETSGEPQIVTRSLDGASTTRVPVTGISKQVGASIIGIRGEDIVVETFGTGSQGLAVVDATTGVAKPFAVGSTTVAPGMAFNGDGSGDGGWNVGNTGIAANVIATATLPGS